MKIIFSLLIKKCFHLVSLVLLLSFFSFLLIRLIPGDPVLVLLGERGGDPEVYQSMKQRMGLDQPLLYQYKTFVTRAIQGDLGVSLISQRPVWEEFRERFTATIELSFMALFLSTFLGLFLGIISAYKQGSIWDSLSFVLTLVGQSLPIFWWGLLMILLFSVHWELTPVSGRMNVLFDIQHHSGFYLIDTLLEKDFQAFKEAFRHLILPAFVLSTIPLVSILKMTQSSVRSILQEDYVHAARARGLPPRTILIFYVLKNALIPLLTIFGLTLSSLITGAILTETLFSWPGLGRWIIQGLLSRDYPVLQGGILILSTLVVLIQFFLDVSYLVFNPRLRQGH
jgi:dipeptide transport system permease protein